MDTIVRVKSVGVLGLSSKITTFVIDIELDGGKLKIEDQLLHFKNTLRTSYREYDERANSNMRCDSLKSLMIINKLSKFL
ncbi:hypothetical protein KTI07_16790 [Acinetobacter lwoffii]|uniref:hypothetical protein n=1 Tax=Acinetobacter lwoffii TaxID=28090 RepID=UPI0021CDD332|nr:hypothetical protein [Acinetobacter lwoffii]MCU4441083.1 hypothetical protein [Acinetobacter lwoffii]